MNSFGEPGDEIFPSSRHLKWIVTTLLVYFGLRLLFFAITISPYVPPDEVTHFGICKIFSRVFLLPENSADSYQYGLVTNIPWLYYWIMGKLLVLNIFGTSDLVFLRILNIPIAFATVYFVRCLVLLLTSDRLTEILVVVAMTNTLMFSFLSASVSYDNLASLLAAMAIYYLFAFFKERSGNLLLLSLLSLLAGCLVKITFLPLAVILSMLFVIREIRKIRTFPYSVMEFFKLSGRRWAVVLAGIVIGLLLNIQLYGGNTVQYGTINPAVEAVLPLEKAMKYRLTARNHIFNLFKQGKITIEQAKEMAKLITHPGDRKDATNIVENYAYRQQAGFKPLGPLPYTAMWILQMLSTSFGIKAHLGMPNHGFSFIPLTVLVLCVLTAYVVRWRPWDLNWIPSSLLGVSVCYAAFLLIKINYPNYLDSTDIVFTVAGRYIFPVMGPVYAVSCLYLMRLFRGEKRRLKLAAMAALILITSDFPFFLSRVTPEWYDWTLK
jgi:hypothetical protein